MYDCIDWAQNCIAIVGRLGNRICNETGKTNSRSFLQGAKDSDVPQALQKYGDALVGWNSGNLAEAISGKNIWLNADNTERAENASSRSSC